MESRGPEDSKNVKTSQAYFFEGFISFFEDFSLTMTRTIVEFPDPLISLTASRVAAAFTVSYTLNI